MYNVCIGHYDLRPEKSLVIPHAASVYGKYFLFRKIPIQRKRSTLIEMRKPLAVELPFLF